MPPDIRETLYKALVALPDPPLSGGLTLNSITGGYTNAAYQVLTRDNRRWFCKFNDNPDFPDLFVKETNGRRLEPQLRKAYDSGLLNNAVQEHFQRLYRRLPEFFSPGPPALLHCDLWSGNFLCAANNQPALIDPAVYYGHRHMDLAMTTLIGGFDQKCYASYNHHYQLEPNYRRHWEIANLYPLLIHLNLFGQAYLPNILQIIQRF